MAFPITFYKNVSSENKLVKELTNSTVLQNCKMWEGTSLLDPVFIMKKSDVLLHSNYCWALGRYYFIKDIEAAPGGQLKISCHCDVLFTYANEIKECNAIVSRQEKNFNTYQTDPEFSFKNEKKISNLLFPYGFSASNQFLLCVNGK